MSNFNSHKLECKRCIMDSINDPDLVLDANNICNHCNTFDIAFNSLPKEELAIKEFKNIISKIKKDGEKNKYDCIIGVSGGVDSTYLCLIAKKEGLRPLLVHCDNGWNSELAVMNIQKIINKTNFDLETLVIDWNEMKDLQLSFLKANVVDIELPYDYALIITAYKAAERHKIKYILSGHNIITEGTYLPKSWRHTKLDFTNIYDIHNKFGKVKLKTFPYYNFFQLMKIKKKLSYISLLNYCHYNKNEVK